MFTRRCYPHRNTGLRPKMVNSSTGGVYALPLHDRSRTYDHRSVRAPTIPGRRTSVFHRPCWHLLAPHYLMGSKAPVRFVVFGESHEKRAACRQEPLVVKRTSFGTFGRTCLHIGVSVELLQHPRGDADLHKKVLH